MVAVTRLVLDVLKPHHPSVIELAKALCEEAGDARVSVVVEERDEKTESLAVIVEGADIQIDALSQIIVSLGGSVHSIDEVRVEASPGGQPA